MDKVFTIFPNKSYSIGRSSTSEIVLMNEWVSSSHARLDCTAEICTLTNLDDERGTLLNGRFLQPDAPVRLQSGDVLEIVPYRLVYSKLAQSRMAGAPKEQPVASLHVTDIKSTYVQYLPEIYDSPFTHCFLALFESIWSPIEWISAHFDLYLNPHTAPADFLPWLANWFNIAFDASWSEAQRRQLLSEAHWIFRRRGTKVALARILAIYTGKEPLIDDESTILPPHTFTVTIPLAVDDNKQRIVRQLIAAHKPAHTQFELSFVPGLGSEAL